MLLAPQLVGEARARRQRKMDRRERVVEGTSAILFLAVAIAIAALVDSPREVDPVLIAALVLGYAAVSRVRFEFSDVYVSAEQLVFIVMIALLPIQLVPLLVVRRRLRVGAAGDRSGHVAPPARTPRVQRIVVHRRAGHRDRPLRAGIGRR